MLRFVEEVRTVVDEGGGEEVVPEKVAALLRSLLNEPDVLDPRYTRPKTGNYVLYPIWVEPGGRFSIASAVWDAGQVTPVHDHGTWGVIGIYRGIEHEVRYRSQRDGGAIHVYGADIGAIRRHVYDLQTGDVRTFVSGWTAVEA